MTDSISYEPCGVENPVYYLITLEGGTNIKLENRNLMQIKTNHREDYIVQQTGTTGTIAINKNRSIGSMSHLHDPRLLVMYCVTYDITDIRQDFRMVCNLSDVESIIQLLAKLGKIVYPGKCLKPSLTLNSTYNHHRPACYDNYYQIIDNE